MAHLSKTQIADLHAFCNAEPFPGARGTLVPVLYTRYEARTIHADTACIAAALRWYAK